MEALKNQEEKVNAGLWIDIILALLLIISIVINFSTIGMPLIQRKKGNSTKVNQNLYGGLPDEISVEEKSDY